MLNKFTSKYSKVIYITLIFLMGIGIAIQFQSIFKQPKNEFSQSLKTKLTRFIPPSPTVTPSPTITPLPTKILPTQPALLTITIVAIDYSKARPNGILTDAKIKLYKSSGELIAEKTVSPYIQEGPVGRGGDAQFTIPFGSYRAEAESGNKKGTVSINLTSYDDPRDYSIYAGAKSIQISGRYFIDANGNTSYDQGEEMLPDKKVYAVVDTEGRLYTAAETTTDEKGYYNLYATINGKYSMQGEAGPGYSPQPSLWANLQGGESITYDIYAKRN